MTPTTITAPPAYSPAALEYETPAAATRRPGHWFLIIVVAVASGLLFANPFADAAGFPSDRRDEGVMLRVVCGAMVAFVVGGAFASLIRVGRRLADTLAQAKRTPDRVVGFVLIGCGTVCVLAAAGLEACVLKYGGSGVVTFGDVPRYTMPGPVLLAQLVCVLILLAGAAQSAVGLWALLTTPRQA